MLLANRVVGAPVAQPSSESYWSGSVVVPRAVSTRVVGDASAADGAGPRRAAIAWESKAPASSRRAAITGAVQKRLSERC